MGISTNFYTVFGFKIDEVDEDFMEDHYEHGEDLFVLLDGMGGEYTIFGIKLFDSGDMRYGFEDGDCYIETDISTLLDRKYEYINKFTKIFPEYKSYLLGKDWKIITMAHIS